MSRNSSWISDERSWWTRAVLLSALAAVIYFSNLGGYPLLDPDEGRYAEIPREMLESGDFITPRLNYVAYFEKPPLFYWAVAGSMALFGQKEWAVRIVPALAGFLTILVIVGLGRRFFGKREGILAGWVYLTSAVPLALARMPIIDGLFSLFLTATWGAWWLGYESSTGRGRRIWFCLAWACMGLACMTKGIAAVALTGLIVFSFTVLTRNFRPLRSMMWLPGLFIFAAIVVPWHVAVSLRNPEFLHYYIVVQHFSRLVSEEHSKPFWFFLLIFPAGMLFWTALFFPAAASAIGRGLKAIRWPRESHRGVNAGEKALEEGQGEKGGGDRPERALFLVVWVAAVVGLFSLSRCKLVPYILPAYPAMAILMASYLTGGARTVTPARWCAGITAILLLIPIPIISYYARTQDMLPLEALVWPVSAAQAALLLGCLILVIALFRHRFIPAATGLVLLALMPAAAMIVPVAATHRKVGGFMGAMPVPLPEGVRVAEWRTYDQGLSFYTGRRTILVDNVGELEFGRAHGDNGDFFLKGEESLKRLAEEGPLLVNLRPGDWPRVRKWGIFQVMAANSTNIMVGNEEFFRETGLAPWPDRAVTPPPLLLLPRKADPPGGE